MKTRVKSVFYGLSVGDALGVPVELKSKKYLEKYPVTGYIENNKPIGFYSDDSALSFCLAESLISGYNIEDIKEKMLKWYEKGYWSATGETYGIGGITEKSLYDLKNGINDDYEKFNINSNGNGSLMRLAPLAFYLKNKPIYKKFEIIKEVSEITHGHIRTIIACFYYEEFMRFLLSGKMNKFEIYELLKDEIPKFLYAYIENDISEDLCCFDNLLKKDIFKKSINEIKTSRYVVDTLEASIYCLLTTNNYKEAVLKAVNLGGDTDTIASITGGLAGLLYGFNNIPKEWIKNLIRNEDIEDLCNEFSEVYQY